MAKTSTRKSSDRNPLSEFAAAGGCPACRNITGDAADYFRHAFAPGESPDLAAEALAEALGYCGRHGALLLAHGEFAGTAPRILSLAAARTLPWLDEAHLHDEHVQRVFFPAADACPACRFDDLRLARQTGHAARETIAVEPRALCLDHFRAAASSLHPEQRLPALARYATMLEDASDGLARGKTDPAVLLALVAGTRAPPAAGVTIDLVQACPVCIDEALAHRRWVDNVRRAAEFGIEGGVFFPTCSAHVREIAALGNPATTLAVVAHALDRAQWQLRGEIEALVRLLAREDLPLRDWTRRRRRKNTAPAPVKPARRTTFCPGCERQRIARDQSITRMLERLEDGRRRRTPDEDPGLCMKHFAAACLLAPKGAGRSWLIARQREKLERIAAELPASHTNPKETQSAWQAAVHLFTGFAVQLHVPAASGIS